MADSRIALIDQLSDQLALLVVKTKNDIRSNLGSTNVVAETILCGLLNRMYDWNLVNANSISQNYPGVDLIDERNNIAVQVTSPSSRSPSPKSDPKKRTGPTPVRFSIPSEA